MMRLSKQERAEALDILRRAGIEGTDAETLLDTLARLTAPATSLTEWVVTTSAHLHGASLAERNDHLTQQVGNDGVRAAAALLHHHNG